MAIRLNACSRRKADAGRWKVGTTVEACSNSRGPRSFIVCTSIISTAKSPSVSSVLVRFLLLRTEIATSSRVQKIAPAISLSPPSPASRFPSPAESSYELQTKCWPLSRKNTSAVLHLLLSPLLPFPTPISIIHHHQFSFQTAHGRMRTKGKLRAQFESARRQRRASLPPVHLNIKAHPRRQDCCQISDSANHASTTMPAKKVVRAPHRALPQQRNPLLAADVTPDRESFPFLVPPR